MCMCMVGRGGESGEGGKSGGRGGLLAYAEVCIM